MFKIFLATVAVAIFASSAQAEIYKCEIESYGSPVNFAGSRVRQKELMASWMPYKTFYVEANGETALMHHSGDLRIESKSSDIDGSPLVYVFRDYPVASSNKSRQRDTRFIIDPSNNKFTVKIHMNNGSRYKNSDGTAFGTCSVS